MKITKCDECGKVTQTYKGKHGLKDKRLCKKCMRKTRKQLIKMGNANPNMVR